MNILLQPYMNVLKFHLINPVLIPQYVSKHIDDWNYQQTIGMHEEQTEWIQQWMTIDPIRLQMESNYGTLPVKLYRCSDGAEVYDTTFQNLQENFFRPGFFIRQLDLDMVPFPPDIYYMIIDGKYISEIFETRVEQPGTVALEPTHYQRRGGIRFNSPTQPFQPLFRVPGRLRLNDTASNDIIYEDDNQAEVMIQSDAYDVYEFFVGNSGAGEHVAGVPPWFMKRVKLFCGCSNLKIDGRLYTKMKGEKWENFTEEGTLLTGAKHLMREKLNREAMVYEDDVEIIGIAAAGLITDTKGFGLGDNSGDDYQEIDYVQ